MMITTLIFWILIGLICYSYFGYNLIVFITVIIKRVIKKDSEDRKVEMSELPEVTLFVAAYNEKDYLEKKVRNSFDLDYPPEKVKHLWVTDGSDDGTPELLRKFPEIQVLHQPERKGKIAAMNRGMKFVKTPIVIFSDGNTTLGRQSILEIAGLMRNPKVGCVAGEKRIVAKESDGAAGSGEGFYWKYESHLKKMEAEMNTVIGAAGELFAIRTELFEEVEPDTLLDDFIISLRIAEKGYSVQYSPDAYAIEIASANVKEEMKRKIRIAAGGIQSIGRLKELLNPFRFGLLSFQYISHKILRWVVTPLAMLLVLPVNYILAANTGLFEIELFPLLFWIQCLFYFVAFIGWLFENRTIRLKVLFVPYYLFVMNLAMYLGFFRYIGGRQSVAWERAKRG